MEIGDYFIEIGDYFSKQRILMKTKKMRDARTSRFQAVARRDLCSEAQS